MKEFDPTKYGATPVQESSGGFDPSQYGATPYDAGNTDINKTAALLGWSTAANERLQNINQPDDSTVNNPERIQPYIDKAQQAQANASQVESEATLGSTIKNGVKSIANETIRGIGSVVRSPIDVVRGLLGMSPLQDKIGQFGGGTVPTVQAEAATNAGKVFDQQMTPLQATGEAVSGALSTANVLGAEDVAKVGSDVAAKVAGTDMGKAVISGVKDILGSRSTNKVIEEVSPRLTPQVAENAATKTSLLRGKTTIVPTDHTKEVADAVKDVVKGKSFSQDKELVRNAISTEAKNLKSYIKEVDHAVPGRELKSALAKVEKPIMVKSDNTVNNYFDNVVKKANSIIDESKGTVSGLLDGRQEFDKMIQKEFPNLYSDEKMTPIREAVKSIRNQWNDFMEGQLAGDPAFKESLHKQSLMYDAFDNLSEKAAKGAPKVQGEIGTTRLDRMAARHPVVTKGAKAAGAGALGLVGGGAAYEVGKKGVTGHF